VSLLPDPQSAARTNAAVLLRHGRSRVALALAAGGVAILLQQAGLGHSGPGLFLGIAGYIAIVGLLAWRLRRAGRAGPLVVGATIAADLSFVFAFCVATSSAASYERVLIPSFFVLHLTELYFGRAYAATALVAVTAAYLALIRNAIAAGAPLSWPDQLWSAGLFATTAVLFLGQRGGFRRRLNRIVDLLDRAEHGDFTKAYDADADRTPDAITSVGRAFDRVRLHLASMVLTDPLTGCFNRRGLDQAIAREIARSSRTGSELSLLAIDLDHFKTINDNHGHVAGDIVLRELGALLVHTARAGDMVARTGGEEFSILLPDTDPAGAYRAGIRVCDAVRTHRFLFGGKRMHCSISVGVVSTRAIGNDLTGTTLLERADEALYAAKNAGRDRVRVWSGELMVV
jgi:diguanylate cyclase (GGDEF)-like protein